jgi:uncharacterized repeat protein (TIGR01451 family)
VDGAPQRTSSNASTLRVAELFGARLVPRVLRVTVVPGRLTPVPFTLTNIGNSRTSFCLSAEYDDGTVEGYAIDGDSDGLYDPAHDTILADGCTAPLEPGESINLLAFVRSLHGKLNTLTLIARPVIGDGSAEGIVLIGGNGTGGQSRILISLIPQADGDPTLVKSQTVLDPWGGSIPAHRAVVTYRLVATFPGFAADAVVTDPIPAGTAYVPGSLMLDDQPLSDGADGDAGGFDGTAIRVALGDVLSAATHSIQFKVTIQ